MTNNAPAGFKIFEGNVGFVELTGLLMVKRAERDAYLGLRIEDKHCNIAGICHGGMLMTFADMQLGVGGHAIAGVSKKFTPTVQMSCDFVAPALNGAWLEGRTQVIKQTRKLLFATCILTADDKTVFSCSGIMKIPSGTGAYDDVSADLARPEVSD
ncbi:PaaI family thioesterase [Sneathiella sp.]|uniref:PaaI family thioesterase n=1 Tax=Sneathiella sp. TaxID=1964365 RepID=UPI00356AFCF2